MATLPDTKPRPVVNMSRLVAAAFAVITALVAIPALQDIPHFFTGLAVASALLTGLALYFGVTVETETVPFVQSVSYIDQDDNVVAGPADAALVKQYDDLTDEVDAPASGEDDYEPKHLDSAGVPRI